MAEAFIATITTTDAGDLLQTDDHHYETAIIVDAEAVVRVLIALEIVATIARRLVNDLTAVAGVVARGKRVQ